MPHWVCEMNSAVIPYSVVIVRWSFEVTVLTVQGSVGSRLQTWFRDQMTTS